MKKMPHFVFLAFFFISLLQAEELTVLARQAALRTTPNSWAKAVTILVQGDKITVSPYKEGDLWHKAKSADGKSGWIHQSAVTVRKVELSTRKFESQGRNHHEVALAAKGFNEDVENKYKAKHAMQKHFRLVDSMEMDFGVLPADPEGRKQAARSFFEKLEEFRRRGNLIGESRP